MQNSPNRLNKWSIISRLTTVLHHAQQPFMFCCMSTKLLFDTLDYARILKNGGVENADIHASSLSQALLGKLYTKDEIDMRFEQALNRVDASLHEFRLSQEKLRNEMKEIELRFE